MNYAWDYGSDAPKLITYKISATFATAGGYATVSIADGGGLVLGLRTSVVSQVGSFIDTGTYSTTQGDVEGDVLVITNPMAVYKMRCVSGGEGNQLDLTTNSVLDTAGTGITITTGDPAPNSPEMDEGTIVCVSGANVGQTRKITSTSATVATVTVPFLRDIAVNDQFVVVPWTPGDTAGDNINLDNTIGRAQHNIAVGTGAEFRPVALEFDTASVSSARQNSHVYAVMVSHVVTQGT